MSNPFGNLISSGEGGYGSFNRGHAGDAHGQTIDFSSMTLAEVRAAQHLGRHDPNRLFAIGKYQIIPDTLDDAVNQLKLDANQKFTPELQERIFADYLIAARRPAIEAYVRGEPGATLHGAQKAASVEWASVDDPDTPGRPYKQYIGTGNNHSSIRAGQVADALDQMRAQYQTDIDKGMSPSDAWKKATGGDGVPAQMHPAPHRATHGHATHHSVLVQGDHGAAVERLQTDLRQLGYITADGKSLPSTGHFGHDTKHAVKNFQRDHHLAPMDGKVGHDTRAALHAAMQARGIAGLRLDHIGHPDHAMYKRALAGVHAAEVERHIAPGLHSERLAAALVVAARSEGITRIDNVALSESGHRAFARENESISDPTDKFAFVETNDAIHTTLAHSTAALAQVNQQHEWAQTRTQTAPLIDTPEPALTAPSHAR